MNESKPVVFFDGICNFCNARVNFILKHDKKDHFRFAPLQSDFAKEKLHPFGINTDEPDSFILLESGKIYQRTTAALRIAKKLNGLWPAFYILIIVPPFIRDITYRIIAKNRYRWWGKMESCMIPTPEVKKKFLG